tara:strand:- start:822 stop:1361 length:540 start_codon:yes stop_codon:yes gene_type:complete
MLISASVLANSQPEGGLEVQRMDTIAEQIKGSVVGVNSVKYGGGELLLPVIQSDSEICVSLINSMHAYVEAPLSKEDYSTQIAVHCDELVDRESEISGKTNTSKVSKGFKQTYLIELDNGVVMHSVRYTSGTIKIWPTQMYDDFLLHNDKKIKSEMESNIQRDQRRESKTLHTEESGTN